MPRGILGKKRKSVNTNDSDVRQSKKPSPGKGSASILLSDPAMPAAASSVFDASIRVTRQYAAAVVPDPVGDSPYKPVVVTLEDASKSKTGLSPIGAATEFTKRKIGKYVPHVLADNVAKPILKKFREADEGRATGKSYIRETHDRLLRPLSVFGVAESGGHERGETPQVQKGSFNQDNSHGFPQSSVRNPGEADRVSRMVAENYVGNQGTTRAIERFMDKQAELDADRGNIGKMRDCVFAPSEKTFAPEIIRDSVLRRSDSLNHLSVLFSMEHNNADIAR